MQIPFTKAHGAKNDFLLTRSSDAPRATCRPSRKPSATGIRAWAPTAGCLSSPPPAADHDAAIRLFNSDGSEAEISGNGTRCAAAFLIGHGHQHDEVRVRTGAGIKRCVCWNARATTSCSR